MFTKVFKGDILIRVCQRRFKMIKNSKVADLILVLTAIIWGTGFIGTEYALQTGASASLITAMRFLLAGIIMGAIAFKSVLKINKKTFMVGFIAGALLFCGFYLQTLGQSMTTVSNSSFLTSTNVVMVPFIVWIITKEHPKTRYFILAFTCFVGISILTLDLSAGFSFNAGDVLVLGSAICFALHIAFLGTYANGLDTKQMTFLQLIVVGVLALIFMLLFDRSAIDFVIMKQAFPPVLYLAIFSSCLCYYMQTTAQQHTSPSKTGIILSLEGFFGSLFAIVLGLDSVTYRLILGGIIIITSVVLSEVDFSKKEKKDNI